MDWLGITLLALAAVTLAANQALKDAPNLTAKLQWLRPKGWWSYAPLTLLIFAGIAYSFSWLRNDRQADLAISSPQSAQSESRSLNPNTLPANVSKAYVELMSGNHTDLQEERFLAAHVGKRMNLTLKLASMGRDGDSLRGQFYAGSNPEVFVHFAQEWSDHLLDKNVGDFIRFQTKIVEENGHYRLRDAEPI